jgi:hypothetical protein
MEWRLAAEESHLTWREFLDLEGEAQSEIVATYRVKHRIEAVLAYEAEHKR